MTAIADLHCAKVELVDNKPGLIVRVTFDAFASARGSSQPLIAMGR